MARRLIIIVGTTLALAVASAVRSAPAQTGVAPRTAPPAAPRTAPARLDRPEPPAPPPPVEEVPAPDEPGPIPAPGELDLPPETTSSTPSQARTEATHDDEVMRAQEPGAAPPSPGQADPANLLPPGRLSLGPQAVGLTVDVQSPPVVNLNQAVPLKVVVKNTGKTEAMGVEVRDLLPDGLEFLDASPPEPVRTERLLVWKLGTLTAGSERVLKIRVKPKVVMSFDHAATVVAITGAKARTQVKQPKLRVEQTASPSKVLKGQRVQFSIIVSNPGTGPARDVRILAKLSAGLRHDEGAEIGQKLDLLDAGQSLRLDPIIADALAGGTQSCEVSVQSSDVVPATPEEAKEATHVQSVEVVEPALKLDLVGPPRRYTDMTALYKLTVSNPGTAPAHDVRVRVTLPRGGKLLAHRSKYDPSKGTLFWSIPQLEPGDKPTELEFQVQLEHIQTYRVRAEAVAQGPLSAKDSVETDVQGVADVRFGVSGNGRFLDVGEEAVYEVRIKNYGTKDASNLLVNAQLSKNLQVVKTAGTEQDAAILKDENVVKFPDIVSLAPGVETVLSIKVKATAPDPKSFCRISILHAELKTPIEHTVPVLITDPAQPAPNP